MKKLIIIFSFLPIISFAQENAAYKNTIGGGILFSPDYCYRKLTVWDNNIKWVKSIRDDIEVPKFGYTVGMNFIRSLLKNVNVECAFLFSQKGYREKKRDIIVADPNDPIFGNMTAISARYNYEYLDIPLGASYYLLREKWSFFISGGISAEIFLQGKQIFFLYYKDGSIGKNKYNITTSTRNISFAGWFGAGAELNVSKHLIFRVEPIFRHFITAKANTRIKTYFYSAGIAVGVNYQL